MALYGRQENPGEPGIGDIIDQRGVLNRTIRAQVVDVNGDDGYVILNYEALPSGGRYATVAPLWMSFPEVGGASWGRYMPQPSDLVKIAFDYDDRPHIVGFDVVAGKAGVGDGSSGWPQINKLYKDAKANPDAKIKVTKNGATKDVSIARYAQFTPLNPGEFDFMSSGGAYVYGTNRGKLYMAGGSVSISLVKNDLLLSSNAQLWAHKADDCDFRFGQVRRPGANQLETKISVDPDGSFKEMQAILKTTVSPGISLDIASLRLGNIVNQAGIVENGPLGGPLRYSMKAHNALGIETHSSTVDENGNYVVGSASASMGAKFDFVSGAFQVNSPNIQLQGPAGVPPAIHNLLLTGIYRPAEDAVITALAAQIAALAGVVTALVGQWAAITSSALSVISGGGVPIDPVMIAIGPILAGLAPVQAGLATATSAVATGAPAAASAFTTAGPTYLSTIAKNG